VHTLDDLADLAVDELSGMTQVDADTAKDLIMKAREHWFTAAETQEAASQEAATQG
jgi:N utilization substance protein A